MFDDESAATEDGVVDDTDCDWMPKRAARACNFSLVAGEAVGVDDVMPNFFARNSKRSLAVISESFTTFFDGSSLEDSVSAGFSESAGAADSTTGTGTEMFRLSEIGLVGTDELEVSGDEDLIEPVGDLSSSSCVESSRDWSSSSYKCVRSE